MAFVLTIFWFVTCGGSVSCTSTIEFCTVCNAWLSVVISTPFVSSGKGYFLGLPLFPFGFGGSIGYFLGLPLPLFGSCGISATAETSSICSCGSIVGVVLFKFIFSVFSILGNVGSILSLLFNVSIFSSVSSNPGNVISFKLSIVFVTGIANGSS